VVQHQRVGKRTINVFGQKMPKHSYNSSMEKKKVDWPFVESVKEKMFKTLEKLIVIPTTTCPI